MENTIEGTLAHTEDLGTFREQKKTSVRGLETSWILRGIMLKEALETQTLETLAWRIQQDVWGGH